MKLSHDVMLALAYVSQISDPDAILRRFMESLNGLDERVAFEFVDRVPSEVPEHRILPVATLRSAFGYALLTETLEISEDERAIFRNAFQFLAVLLENRIQARALESRMDALLKEIRIEKSLVRTVLDTLPVGVWVADENGRIILGNSANEKIWNSTREVAGSEWLETGKGMAPKDWGFAQTVKSGQTIEDQEIDITCFDGARKTILHSAAPIRNENGNVIGAVGVNQDITERKQAEEALESERAFLSAVFDNIQEAIVICDHAGRLVRFNEAARRLHGVPEKPIAPDQWAEHYDLFEKDGHRPLPMEDIPLYRALQGERVQNVEIVVAPKHSTPHSLVCNGQALTDETGTIIGAVVAMHDITLQKEMESRLQQSQKLEAIGNLAGGIAHDFNNILGIVLGNAELAMDDVPDWNPAKESLKEIRAASLRAKGVVQQILSFARKTMTGLKPLEINGIVKESFRLIRASIPAMIEIQLNLPSKPMIILGDATEIHQIVINLCTNAAHAMKKTGGTLEMEISEVHLDPETAARYEGVGPGDFVRMTVRDSGEGIPDDILTKVFEPYFTTKKLGEGTGMGLAVVYGLVKKCKGAIEIISTPGKGTVVDVLFPKIEAKAPSDIEMKEALPTGRERILLVDDDEAIVRMLRRMLEGLGYSVEGLTDSVAALDRFRSNPDEFDLVITDMSMPRMSGDQLAAGLMKVREDVPILLCTGHSDRIDGAEAKRVGIAEFAMKPLDKDNLARSVRRVLDSRKQS